MSPELIVSIGSLLVALANAFAIIWAAVKGLEKVEQIHQTTNSKMDLLLSTTKSASLAVGNLEGRKEQTAERQADPTVKT